MPSSCLILCCPLLLPPSIFSSIRGLTNESVLHIRRPKYWSFSFSISPSNEYSGLISFRKHWLDLLAVQGTLKSILQHHSSKAPILQLVQPLNSLTLISLHHIGKISISYALFQAYHHIPSTEQLHFPHRSTHTVREILQARILEWAVFPSPGIFPTQRLNPGLLHCRQIPYQLRHQRSP